MGWLPGGSWIQLVFMPRLPPSLKHFAAAAVWLKGCGRFVLQWWRIRSKALEILLRKSVDVFGGLATNGVVESFYDFFAQLYSTSFTANPPWATGAVSTDPVLAPLAAPWEVKTVTSPGAMKENLDKTQIQEVRSERSDGKPHRLEFGWPEDDKQLRTPKTSEAKKERRRASAPEGFPEPMAPLAGFRKMGNGWKWVRNHTS